MAVYGGDDELAALAALTGDVVDQPVDGDWAERWRAFHRPVVVGRLWVGPPWEEPWEGLVPVVVDPGQAFGTGAHPTTRLCLELLLSCSPTSLVDLGCGSGVLSIAAAKLGFRPVVAVDVDAAAVRACRRNAAVNGVCVEVRCLDLRVGEPPVAELAVANLERRLIESVAPRLRASLLVASGYLEHEAVSLAGWRRIDRRTAGGWAAELFERSALPARQRGRATV